MRTTSKLLALALTATMQSAMAGAVLLDFEDLTASEKLTTRYAGVTASGAAWAVTSEACNFGGLPGDASFIRSGSCGALWLTQDPANDTKSSQTLTLTLASGFIDAVSFIFSSGDSTSTMAVHVFDQNDKELGLGLAGLNGVGCSGYVYCNWSSAVNLTFTGVARKVTFTSTDQTMMLDDIRFTTPATGGRLPEPTSVALTLGALGALGWSRKRAAR